MQVFHVLTGANINWSHATRFSAGSVAAPPLTIGNERASQPNQ